MKTCYWIIIPSVRKRLLNRATTRRGGKVEGKEGEWALSKPNPLSLRLEKVVKRNRSSFPPSLSLSLSRFCSSLFAVRSSPFSFSLLVAFVISSSRRPVSVPRRTLNWQSAFEGVNIVLFPPRGEKRRRDASFFEEVKTIWKSLDLSLSLSLEI